MAKGNSPYLSSRFSFKWGESMFIYQTVAFKQIVANVLRLPQTITIKNGQYLIERPVNFDIQSGDIGSSQALVYKGRDIQSGEDIALKQVLMPNDAAACERHRRECLFLLGMKHRNIVSAIDEFMDGSERFLLLEWLPGLSIGEEIRNFGPVSGSIAKKRLIALCQTLTFVQSAGFLFRDLNEGNIFTDRQGSAKITLLDFGGILPIGSERSTRLLPPSAAPESLQAVQTGRKHGFSVASDIYSACALTYYMLTAQPVPDDRKCTPLIPIERFNRRVDHSFAAVILAGLSIDSRQRPATLVELRRLIEQPTSTAPRVIQPTINSVACQYLAVIAGLRRSLQLSIQQYRQMAINWAQRIGGYFNAKRQAFILTASIICALIAGLFIGHIGVEKPVHPYNASINAGITQINPNNLTASAPGLNIPIRINSSTGILNNKNTHVSAISRHSPPKVSKQNVIENVVIRGNNINLRVSPNLNSDIVGTVSSPKQMKLLGQKLGWLHIAAPDGTDGYLWGAYVMPIPGGYGLGQARYEILLQAEPSDSLISNGSSPV